MLFAIICSHGLETACHSLHASLEAVLAYETIDLSTPLPNGLGGIFLLTGIAFPTVPWRGR